MAAADVGASGIVILADSSFAGVTAAVSFVEEGAGDDDTVSGCCLGSGVLGFAARRRGPSPTRLGFLRAANEMASCIPK